MDFGDPLYEQARIIATGCKTGANVQSIQPQLSASAYAQVWWQANKIK